MKLCDCPGRCGHAVAKPGSGSRYLGNRSWALAIGHPFPTRRKLRRQALAAAGVRALGLEALDVP